MNISFFVENICEKGFEKYKCANQISVICMVSLAVGIPWCFMVGWKKVKRVVACWQERGVGSYVEKEWLDTALGKDFPVEEGTSDISMEGDLVEALIIADWIALIHIIFR